MTPAADTTAPVLQTATVNGTTLVLTYNEALDTGSVPAATDYTVSVGGTTVTLARASPVAVSGMTVTLTLAAAVVSTDVVTVTYAVPTTNPVKDLAGQQRGGAHGRGGERHGAAADGLMRHADRGRILVRRADGSINTRPIGLQQCRQHHL